MNGSSILKNWIKVRTKKKQEKNRIERRTVQAPFVHCIRLCNGISFSPFYFIEEKKKKNPSDLDCWMIHLPPFLSFILECKTKILWWFCCFLYLSRLWFSNPKVSFFFRTLFFVREISEKGFWCGRKRFVTLKCTPDIEDQVGNNLFSYYYLDRKYRVRKNNNSLFISNSKCHAIITYYSYSIWRRHSFLLFFFF